MAVTFEKLFRVKPMAGQQEAEFELARYRREFGQRNGTKWFCESVPLEEAQRRHAALTKPLFKVSRTGLNITAALIAELASDKPEPGEPDGKATCPECGKRFEPDEGPDGKATEIVTCPKCGEKFNPESEPEPTEYESNADEAGLEKLAALFRVPE